LTIPHPDAPYLSEQALIIRLFPLETGRAAHRRNVEALQALDDAGLITYLGFDQGYGRLRTSAIYLVKITVPAPDGHRAHILRIGTNDVEIFAQGIYIGSGKAFGRDGSLRDVVKGAWVGSFDWYMDKYRILRDELAVFRTCATADGGPCELCLKGNFRQVAPEKCHEPLKPEEESERTAYGFHGCQACWRKIAIAEASTRETLSMIHQFWTLMSAAERENAVKDPDFEEVRERVDKLGARAQAAR
jgi:hypothetical protein